MDADKAVMIQIETLAEALALIAAFIAGFVFIVSAGIVISVWFCELRGERPMRPSPLFRCLEIVVVAIYMQTLAWPPLQQQTVHDPEDEKVHRWQAAPPSKPDRSQQPLPPDGNYDSSSPIY